jgi:hypothetical protein
LYVWGGGVAIKSEDPDVQKVLDAFFKDSGNQGVIGRSWEEREKDQRLDGNTFFCFFVNKANGAARVRLLDMDETLDIHFNPDDRNEPWFYERQLPDGSKVMYPDIYYNPKAKPGTLKGVKIEWDVKVLHVKTGGLTQMKFGLPELYSTLNWARAYKGILENFATILKAYARFAMKISGLGSSAKTAAAKSRMNTAMTPGNFKDTNPPNNTAAWFAASGGVDIAAIKTSNSTTGPDEARALRSMVAAGGDTPEHFFGDSDIGNFATSTTLDRPTELKMIARQKMWQFVIECMCRNLIIWSTQAPLGRLNRAGFKSTVDKYAFDPRDSVNITSKNGEPALFSCEFPNILERDVVDRIRSVVQGITLNGRPAEGIIPNRKYACRLILEALAVKDIDRVVDKLYPEDVKQGFMDPDDKAENEKLTAQGRKLLGDAAVIAAKNPPKPAPKAKVKK